MISACFVNCALEQRKPKIVTSNTTCVWKILPKAAVNCLLQVVNVYLYAILQMVLCDVVFFFFCAFQIDLGLTNSRRVKNLVTLQE